MFFFNIYIYVEKCFGKYFSVINIVYCIYNITELLVLYSLANSILVTTLVLLTDFHYVRNILKIHLNDTKDLTMEMETAVTIKKW